MKAALIVTILLLPATAFAQAAPPMTAEHRLAIQIANLTLQLAHAAEQIDRLQMQLKERDQAMSLAGPNADALVGNVCGAGANAACRQADGVHFSDNGSYSYAAAWVIALHTGGF